MGGTTNTLTPRLVAIKRGLLISITTFNSKNSSYHYESPRVIFGIFILRIRVKHNVFDISTKSCFFTRVCTI
jgi:hypothetical protein